MTNGNHDLHLIPPNRVPDLGQIGRTPVAARAKVSVEAIVRHLDDDGTFSLTTQEQPDGPVPVISRRDYLSAEELVEMIRETVMKDIHKELADLEARLNQRG